jgi:hypothetical protein
MLFEQTNGIVELINRSQGHFRRLSVVEAKRPGDEVGFVVPIYARLLATLIYWY